jgi:hypothetical protein
MDGNAALAGAPSSSAITSSLEKAYPFLPAIFQIKFLLKPFECDSYHMSLLRIQ